MNGNSMREKVIAKIESLEWAVTAGDDGSLELEKYSPAGEDFIFEVKGEDVASEVREYADDFDTDDHVEMWVMARHNVSGVPNIEQAEDLRSDLEKKIGDILSADDGLFPDGLTDEREDELRDMLYDMVSFVPPADHYLKQEFYTNIMVDTGDGNYDYTLNAVYPCYAGEYDEPINDKASIVWLAKQQGYTKEQLENALKADGDSAPEGFLRSMRKELVNQPSHMGTLTFLVKMTLDDLLKLNALVKLQDRDGHHYDTNENPDCGYIVIGKGTETGLYDPWSGGGSVLEVELEKDVELPVKFIRSALPDGGDGYSIAEVYGMCGSVWRETLKEIHEPKEDEE